ncbi:hypothetical protein [Flavobacterium facile]|uniref:hypothetical protein n=1 Tax=Flavobacterium facile TaxID=2893174 RepID=UPI002E797295|nr:hypothetical protein [Flavobacterium sp. T-12]
MTVIEKQSLIDIAIQEHGTCLACFDVALVNGVSITDELMPGQKLDIKLSEHNNPDLTRYFKNKSQKIATYLSAELIDVLNESGLGYMQIENNFKVS